jgi:hypothetical protein
MNTRLKEWCEKHKQEQYEKQYVTMPDGTEKHVTEFEDRSVDWNTYKDLRMNSYALDLFFSKMDDDLLINRAMYYIDQCGKYRYPATTYDEALIHVIVPELIKRLKESKNIQ